jgi:hypothetical protein
VSRGWVPLRVDRRHYCVVYLVVGEIRNANHAPNDAGTQSRELASQLHGEMPRAIPNQ